MYDHKPRVLSEGLVDWFELREAKKLKEYFRGTPLEGLYHKKERSLEQKQKERERQTRITENLFNRVLSSLSYKSAKYASGVLRSSCDLLEDLTKAVCWFA